MVEGRCLQLYTNYDRVRVARETQSSIVEDMSEEEAQLKCQQLGGDVVTSVDAVTDVIKALLHLWRHNDLIGHIKVAKKGANQCRIIEARKDVNPYNEKE